MLNSLSIKKINPNRKTAIIVGILFIIATVFSLVGTSLIGSVIGAPDYLVNVYANKNQVILGVLLLLAAAASVGSDRFWSGCSYVLLFIISIKTHS